jgi:hypothetical protein
VFAVTVRVPDQSALAERMTRMRQWLDHQHVDPVLFRSTSDRNEIVVSVAFRSESDAAAFASEFKGNLQTSIAA